MKHTDWNGYTVYDDGTILNKDGSVKSLKENEKGYLFSNFYFNGRSQTVLAHRIVWYAFKGIIPDKFEIDHVNNDRKDNRLSNLQILNKSDNNRKSYMSGNRVVSGFLNANHRYPQEVLEAVLELLSSKLSYTKIETITGVQKSTVARIAQQKHFITKGKHGTSRP